MKYCLDCEWSIREQGSGPETDLSERAIDHVTETGHSISSDDFPTLPPLRAEIGPELMSVLRALARGGRSENADREP